MTTWVERMSLLIIKVLGLRKNNNITKANIDHVFNSFSVLNNKPTNTVFVELILWRKRMVKYADFVFNFLLYKDVPPDNNSSERTISNFKIKLKISGFFKSFDGAEIFARTRSIIDPAIKNNRSPLLITKLIAQCSE